MSTEKVSAWNGAKRDSAAIRSTSPTVVSRGARSSDSETSTSPDRTRLLPRGSDGWWASEILAVIGAAVALVGIGVLLRQYDNKPLPVWSLQNSKLRLPHEIKKFLHVSLNSVLSLLATLLRIFSLIPIANGLAQLKWVWMAERSRTLADLAAFDAASRGSVSDIVKLVFRLKARHFAVIGALAMIAFHLFDFIVQSLITLPTCPVVDQLQVARIATATTYMPERLAYGGNYQVDALMKSNIWAALYATDAQSDWAIPQYSCSCGACSWENYRSLGVCSRCSDITSMLKRNCFSSNETDPPGVTGCDVSLPNGFNLGGVSKSRHNVMALNTTLSPLVYRNYSSPIAIIQSIIANDTFFVNSSTIVTASECALVPCVVSYKNSSVALPTTITENGYNGIYLQENVLQIWDNFTAPNGTGIYLDMPANETREDITRYFIDQNSYWAWKFYFEALLSGFVSTNGMNSRDYYLSYQSDGVPRSVQADTPGVMQAIYQPLTCTDVFLNPLTDWVMCAVECLAQGMTVTIRDSSFNLASNQVIGKTFVPVVLVEVAWLWMILLGLLWLLGPIMLIGTAIRTRRAGVRKWRGNPLALLFLGIGKVELVDLQDFGWSNNGLKKKADALTVRLLSIDDEEQLVRC